MNENKYLSSRFEDTQCETLGLARYAIIKDWHEFKRECEKYHIIGVCIDGAGIYYWSNDDGIWLPFNDDDDEEIIEEIIEGKIEITPELINKFYYKYY
jgi:hypothetical protein